jgi:hypothetical protein
LAFGDREDDASVLDLVEGERSAPGDLLKDGPITRRERQR